MKKVTTVGVDLAKQVMAVHAIDVEGRTVMRKVLRRGSPYSWVSHF